VTDVAALRPRLFGIAYRILGSVGDAEDVVQDAFIRWTEHGEDGVRDAPAWLTTVTARLAIDRARTLSRRRETYVGQWLPEPLVENDPADDIRQADDLAMGFLRVLERLRPDERTALLLHDAFGYSHAEVGTMLEKSEDAVRQMTSRARGRVQSERPRFLLHPQAARAVVERFIAALHDDDIDGLRSVLATDVVQISDGGGRVNAGLNPVIGVDRVASLLLGLQRKFWTELQLRAAWVNGLPGLRLDLEDGTIFAAIALDFDGERINAIYAVLNPDKLVYANRR
jgi:RNA polymerase sigma-70 factor, ECF subfamily